MGRAHPLHRAQPRSAPTRVPTQPKGAPAQKRLTDRRPQRLTTQPGLRTVECTGEVCLVYGPVLRGVDSECAGAELQQASRQEEGQETGIGARRDAGRGRTR